MLDAKLFYLTAPRQLLTINTLIDYAVLEPTMTSLASGYSAAVTTSVNKRPLLRN